MAHFAEINEEGIVQRVLAISNLIVVLGGEEVEELGTAYLQNMFPDTDWVQTSYNDNFRKRYAGKGMKYDVERDAFLHQQPYPSWTLDEETLTWNPPKPRPEQDEENPVRYGWNENAGDWQEIPEQPDGYWWCENDWEWHPPRPDDGKVYEWSEESKSWVEIDEPE
tara:strand:+ start:1646 stop:2143 length:498 start_codon:yes stop_codon:yes gene_type:complete